MKTFSETAECLVPKPPDLQPAQGRLVVDNRPWFDSVFGGVLLWGSEQHRAESSNKMELTKADIRWSGIGLSVTLPGSDEHFFTDDEIEQLIDALGHLGYLDEGKH